MTLYIYDTTWIGLMVHMDELSKCSFWMCLLTHGGGPPGQVFVASLGGLHTSLGAPPPQKKPYQPSAEPHSSFHHRRHGEQSWQEDAATLR